MSKKILTGIKPTASQLHFGNYFGAIKPMIEFQQQGFDIIAFIADMHSITALRKGEDLKTNIINVLKTYLACGLSTDKVMFFKQSDVPAHAQLNWVLACLTNLGYMKRMHAYKDALDKGKADDTTMGTFNYPILMAADILLYDPDFVPVGKDQKQHLEFARDIAQKFNGEFGETFKLPQPYINVKLATIPGIDGRKMSKSYNNYIGLFEDDATILKKVKSISTDSIPIDQPKDPDKCNLYNILKLFLTEDEKKQMRKRYKAGGLSYKEVKEYLYEKMIAFLTPIRKKANSISDAQIKKILSQGAQKANSIAEKKIKKVYDKIGFNI